MWDKTEPASRFYAVWCLDGNIPRFCHTSMQSATNEAKRLSKGNPGKFFYIMEATAQVYCAKPEPSIINLA